ncbi:MAG TPA: DUF742 domain-containing protein [Mycobacterium sp.]|nr:DUF742 domain-containing protein [Mycobacterium sp.]
MKTPSSASRNEPNLVRPYTLTAGRTTASIELPLEAPIEAFESAQHHTWSVGDVRSDIIKLCATTPSVAEIAARLQLPVGVARVLVGDLVQSGYLRVLTTLHDDSSVEERRELIGRTLRGLRTL